MSLETRVARLERWNRLLLLGMALTAGGSLAWSRVPQAVTRVERLEVIDARGEPRLVLSAAEEGPVVRLLDDSGVARASLGHDAEGTALYLRDGEGTIRVGVAQFAHGGGGFALHGPDARGAAVLYLKGDGSLTFYDVDGGVRARIPDD